MILSVENIKFTGTGAQTTSISVDPNGIALYRISIDTSNQISGDKTVAFIDTPIEGNTILDFIIEGGMDTNGSSKLKIGGVTIPERFALNKSTIRFEFYNSAWNVFIFADSDVSNSIEGAQIIDDTVDPIKLTDAIAGDGMTRDISGGLVPNLDASTSSLGIVGGFLKAKLNAAGSVVTSVNGLAINLEAANPSLQISANQLGVKIASGGGIEKDANGLKLSPTSCVCVKSLSVIVPSADVLNLFTPIVLLAADNTVYRQIISAMVVVKYNTVPYATDTELAINQGGNQVAFNADCLATTMAGGYVFNAIATVDALTRNIGVSGTNAITLSTQVSNPTAGNSDIQISITYWETDRL